MFLCKILAKIYTFKKGSRYTTILKNEISTFY